MGTVGRRRVEVDYSLSAWAETFVGSMTGGSRPVAGSTWPRNRPAAAGGRSAIEPHAARIRYFPSLNLVGKR